MPTASKPAPLTPAASNRGRKRPPHKAVAARRQPAAPPSAAGPESWVSKQSTRAAERREDQLLAALAAVRDLLAHSVMITGERLRETLDEAVRLGRMTREDAEDLVQSLVQIGRHQTQDVLTELEGLVERSTEETRRLTISRVKSVGGVARRAPGGDRALRTVDRMRRATGLGHAFPIIGYDELTMAQVKERLSELSPAELRKVRDHERRNANRKSVLAAIEKQLR
jgi:polyhydroxyalkanoate synthesis regulator phasin